MRIERGEGPVGEVREVTSTHGREGTSRYRRLTGKEVISRLVCKSTSMKNNDRKKGIISFLGGGEKQLWGTGE